MRSLAPAPNAAAGAVADAPSERHGIPAVADEECIGGTPPQVAEQIIEQCRRCGAGHFMTYAPGLITREQAGRSLQLWAEVIPLLRRAALPEGAAP